MSHFLGCQRVTQETCFRGIFEAAFPWLCVGGIGMLHPHICRPWLTGSQQVATIFFRYAGGSTRYPSVTRLSSVIVSHEFVCKGLECNAAVAFSYLPPLTGSQTFFRCASFPSWLSEWVVVCCRKHKRSCTVNIFNTGNLSSAVVIDRATN